MFDLFCIPVQKNAPLPKTLERTVILNVKTQIFMYMYNVYTHECIQAFCHPTPVWVKRELRLVVIRGGNIIDFLQYTCRYIII